jgi:hypothetical protein
MFAIEPFIYILYPKSKTILLIKNPVFSWACHINETFYSYSTTKYWPHLNPIWINSLVEIQFFVEFQCFFWQSAHMLNHYINSFDQRQFWYDTESWWYRRESWNQLHKYGVIRTHQGALCQKKHWNSTKNWISTRLLIHMGFRWGQYLVVL